MKRLWWSVLPLVGVVLSIPSSVWAQRGGQREAQPPGNVRTFSNLEIDVQVRNPDGTPAPRGIHVTLEWAEGGVVGDCQTATGGRCQFIPPSPGTFLVRINQTGYKEVTARLDLTGIQKGFASLDLKPIPGETPPAPPKEDQRNVVSLADLGVPDNARREFDKGQDALKKNNLDSGISHFRKAIQLHESFPQAYTMLGTAYLQRNSLEDAQTALQKAIQLDPKSGASYLELGAAYNQMKNYPEAEKALTHGLELNRDAAGGHYELAKTYWAMGRWQDAEPHALKAVELQPELAPAYVLLGNIMLRKRDAQFALKYFQEYLHRAPGGPLAEPTRQMVDKIEKALATAH